MDEMNKDKSAERPPVHETTSLLHPRVYALMMGLAGRCRLFSLACGVPVAEGPRFERGDPGISTHGRDGCADPTRPPKFCCR